MHFLHTSVSSCVSKVWNEMVSGRWSRETNFRLGYTFIVVFTLYLQILSGAYQFPSTINVNYIIPGVLFAGIMFFSIQGTDPGYLSSKVLEDPEIGLGSPSRRNSGEALAGIAAGGGVNDSCMKCEKCSILVPIRSHHCIHCNKCVATYDHHCTLIGTCIGEKNHCRFWWLLFSHFILILHDLKCMSMSKHTEGSVYYDIVGSIASVVWLFLFFLWLFIVVLLVLHTWLMISNMTGYECFKGSENIEYLKGMKEDLMHNCIYIVIFLCNIKFENCNFVFLCFLLFTPYFLSFPFHCF